MTGTGYKATKKCKKNLTAYTFTKFSAKAYIFRQFIMVKCEVEEVAWVDRSYGHLTISMDGEPGKEAV
jgi:hypothetical protein